jgi:hypothetical protein
MYTARAAAGLRAPVVGWPPGAPADQRWAARACGGWRQCGACGAGRACLEQRLRRVISGDARGGRSPAAAAEASGPPAGTWLLLSSSRSFLELCLLAIGGSVRCLLLLERPATLLGAAPHGLL